MSKPLIEHQCDFTFALALLIQHIHSTSPYSVKIQELNRTVEQQKEYVRTGKSKTMKSKHLDRLAADLVLYYGNKAITDGEAFRFAGEQWERLGGRWGGRFHDKKLHPNFNPDKDLGWDVCHMEWITDA